MGHGQPKLHPAAPDDWMVVSGGLSLAGLVGVPLRNMQVWLTGVVGHRVVALVALLLLGRVLGRAEC
ncbi:hypothetical protein IQ273_17845 [Nodosilinea sp. LEGE 07298]|uniref:hypothetical protein n=1 Tax=Nodosilinea sp. LEGE 07298 TaxID=2777970 RepID=UPI00188163E0|nr:hypothetical protein [Nodosilinea sp. LEGE 07298]MBE9111272.1 hypothetical protein [Nodosilinea sp. LEGE 07298]